MGKSQINNESLTVQSSYMAELVRLANGGIDLLFHATPKNFKEVQSFTYRGCRYKISVDKNGGVYDVLHVVRETKDECVYARDVQMFNLVKGNPFEIAVDRMADEIDYILDHEA